jgi:hypothetical protein
MSRPRFPLYLLVLTIFIVSCGSKKKKPVLSGEEKVEVSDFIDFFQEQAVPYVIADTSLRKKTKDSLLINYKVLTQFVPDTVLSKILGKGVKPKSYPFGKVTAPDGVRYLFMKTVAGDKNSVLLFAFDKKDNFIAAITALKPDNNTLTGQSAVIDRRLTITKTMLRKNADGSVSDGKDVYVLNEEAKLFTLIMTDALDERVTELINPIDTLGRKHKYAADYGTGKMNLVSIRDGRKPDRVTFFIHFDKNNGQCSGELKGEAFWKSTTVAEYREDGDPCVLRFNFSSAAVTLLEQNCGSRRTSLNCSFDGSFGRRKYIKPSLKKGKKPGSSK